MYAFVWVYVCLCVVVCVCERNLRQCMSERVCVCIVSVQEGSVPKAM